jgi:MFS family permease
VRRSWSGLLYTRCHVTSPLWSTALLRILLAQLAFGFSWCLYLVYPKFLSVALGVGPEGIGSVATVAGGVSAASVLLAVRSIDRSRRAVFLRGSALLTACSLGYLCVDRFGPLVYVVQAGVAASYVLAFNATMSAVTDVVPPARLGQAFGLQSAANLGMNGVSTLTAETIAQHFGWRSVFVLAALSSLAALLLGAGLPAAQQRAEAGAVEDAPPYRALAPIFACAAFLGATYTALATFHQPFALGLGVERVSTFFVGYTLGALVMRLGFGNLGDRLGRRSVALTSLALYALVAASMAALEPALLWLYGAGFGLAHGVVYPTVIAIATERAPAGARGRTIASFSGAFSLGMGIAASGWGVLSARHGFPVVFVAAGACALGAGACLLAGTRTGAA